MPDLPHALVAREHCKIRPFSCLLGSDVVAELAQGLGVSEDCSSPKAPLPHPATHQLYFLAFITPCMLPGLVLSAVAR